MTLITVDKRACSPISSDSPRRGRLLTAYGYGRNSRRSADSNSLPTAKLNARPQAVARILSRNDNRNDSAQVLVDGFLNRLFRNVADDLFLYLPALEYEQRRNSADPITHWSSAVVVDIHLADLHSALIVLGQLLHNGSNRPAGPAPNCPEVDQHRSL